MRRARSAVILTAVLALVGLACTTPQLPAPKDTTGPGTTAVGGSATQVAAPIAGAAVRTPAPPLVLATATPFRTATPVPSPTRAPSASFLDRNTLFTVYGVAFDTAPILGVLGAYKNFDDMAAKTKKYVNAIDANNGDKGVITAVHLIYGLAMPCEPGDDCLLYTEGRDIDIVKDYIEPAAKRGWLVILDSQLGRSDPVTQVKRMIDKGYLKYDNVHLALDPEFHARPGQKTPGIPIGTVDASEINAAQKLVDDYVAKLGLPHRKIVMVHQFGDPNVNDGVPFMIQHKKTLKTDFKYVDLVIMADGFGVPDAKINKYNKMTDHEVYPMIKYRGIKIFYPNPYEQAGHYDKPPMDYDVIFGRKPTPGGVRMAYPPDVIIIA